MCGPLQEPTRPLRGSKTGQDDNNKPLQDQDDSKRNKRRRYETTKENATTKLRTYKCAEKEGKGRAVKKANL